MHFCGPDRIVFGKRLGTRETAIARLTRGRIDQQGEIEQTEQPDPGQLVPAWSEEESGLLTSSVDMKQKRMGGSAFRKKTGMHS
jgi:hypothetical protein